MGAGFEPAKLSRQIYSLIPLATREPHQIVLRIINNLKNIVKNFSLKITDLAEPQEKFLSLFNAHTANQHSLKTCGASVSKLAHSTALI